MTELLEKSTKVAAQPSMIQTIFAAVGHLLL